MVERGENAASEKKREIGRAGTKHFPEYSPPRRFKPLKPGLLPPNSNCKTVNIHTIYCFAQFLTISIKRQNPKQVEAGRIMCMGSSISLRGRIAGSYPVQRLVIEPCVSVWNVFWSLDIAFGSWETFCPYEPPYYLPLFFSLLFVVVVVVVVFARFIFSL